MENKLSSKKFHLGAFTLSLGVTWSIFILLAGWMAMFGWGPAFVKVMASIYIGYQPTFLGAVIGAIWGFFDGAIGGFVFAFFYNFFLCRFSRKR